MNEAPKVGAKRPVPWRGRKRVKDPRTKFIAVRCTPEERAAIDRAARQAGLSVGAYLRRQALGTTGPRAVRRPPIEVTILAKLLGQHNKVGSNLNQLAHAYNGPGLIPGFAEMVAIRREWGEMYAALKKALEP
jgi:hypothetical protein